MILALTSYHYIIIFSLTIIISYFFNIYAKKTGIPSVLMLIGLGVLINYVLSSFIGVEKPNLFPILKVIGVFGLILIVLEAALDLSLVKERFSNYQINSCSVTWISRHRLFIRRGSCSFC